jgi:hypothetical protein
MGGSSELQSGPYHHGAMLSQEERDRNGSSAHSESWPQACGPATKLTAEFNAAEACHHDY